MSHKPLAGLETKSINNVYIYIADAVRFEYLPDEISSKGRSFKTAAHALCTPQSVPSIISGKLPPTHGCTWFFHTLPDDIPTLFDFKGFNQGYNELAWSGGAIRAVLNDPDSIELESAKPPFVIIEHDNGGHAPYADTDPELSIPQMYEAIPDERALENHYRSTIDESTRRFQERLDLLEERDLLDDTLVIYLSDHGELIGQRQIFIGHAYPTAPELVYVPTVFIHNSLDETSHETFLHHVDIYPTVADVLGQDIEPEATDGESLLSPILDDRPAYTQGIMHPPDPFSGSLLDPIYDTSSVWSRDGGHVFPKTSILQRFIMSVYDATSSRNTAPFNNEMNIIKRIWFASSYYLNEGRTFGTPSVSRSQAERLMMDIRNKKRTAEKRNIGAETREQLENLGYV